MRNLLAVSLVCLAGCASQPPAANSAPPAAATAVVAPAPAPAGATAAVASTDPNAVQYSDAIKKALKSGFFVSKKNGQKTYCRQETTTGSRFADTVCYTPDQLTTYFAQQQENQDRFQQSGVCGGGGACGGSH